jgi:hypothetical protein
MRKENPIIFLNFQIKKFKIFMGRGMTVGTSLDKPKSWKMLAKSQKNIFLIKNL